MIIDNVKHICRDQGFNLTALALKLGIDKNTLYVKLKNPNIKLSSLQKIADALNCNVVNLIELNSPQQNLHPDEINAAVCPICGAKLMICKAE